MVCSRKPALPREGGFSFSGEGQDQSPVNRSCRFTTGWSSFAAIFTSIRRLAYREEKTAAKIAEVLGDLGIGFQDRYRRDRDQLLPSTHQHRGRPWRFGPIWTRSRSRRKAMCRIDPRHPGMMHACGHDGHIAMALGTARLVERKWPRRGAGKVLFIFQPAEESGAGARAMLDSGAFRRGIG